ncbi:hypothetical protein DHEL01_v209847 [Diaporthe helianthi]|uniref:Uncharacterized protein n=1 Tax=Diaporthe helianthi TaxID=158607 RepID=A0A2P5HNF1_DIAHE|nr:hypothetical protein DHEL01_v209847 [Diaporthe helianthi]
MECDWLECPDQATTWAPSAFQSSAVSIPVTSKSAPVMAVSLLAWYGSYEFRSVRAESVSAACPQPSKTRSRTLVDQTDSTDCLDCCSSRSQLWPSMPAFTSHHHRPSSMAAVFWFLTARPPELDEELHRIRSPRVGRKGGDSSGGPGYSSCSGMSKHTHENWREAVKGTSLLRPTAESVGNNRSYGELLWGLAHDGAGELGPPTVSTVHSSGGELCGRYLVVVVVVVVVVVAMAATSCVRRVVLVLVPQYF